MNKNIEGVNWDVESVKAGHNSKEHFVNCYKDVFYQGLDGVTSVDMLGKVWDVIHPVAADEKPKSDKKK